MQKIEQHKDRTWKRIAKRTKKWRNEINKRKWLDNKGGDIVVPPTFFSVDKYITCKRRLYMYNGFLFGAA